MQSNNPQCFGDLSQVFPMTKDGLRHSPEKCLACEIKSQCLKTTIAGKNQSVMAAEKLERRYRAGRISFLQRWSQKKILHNRLNNKGHAGA